MAFGIMRTEKRNRTSVYGLQIEANRTKRDFENGRDFDKSDIDWEQTENNFFFRKTDNWNKEITRQIKENNLKERKDSIVLLDTLYTASPEFFEDKTKSDIINYFRDCLKFHERTYGKSINAVIHFDEKTPHMQVASIPIIEDEKGVHLSAKIIMGNRTDFRLRQDKFFDEVSSKWQLERGEVKEPSEIKKHTTKRDWQLAIQEDQLEDNDIDLQIQNIKIKKNNIELQKQEQIWQSNIQQNKELKNEQENIYNATCEEVKKYQKVKSLRQDQEQNQPKYIKMYQAKINELQEENAELQDLKNYAQQYIFDDGLSFYDVYEMETQIDPSNIAQGFLNSPNYDLNEYDIEL